MQLKKKKVILVFIIVGFFAIVAIAAILYLKAEKKTTYDGELQIANLNQVVGDRPSDKETLEYIKYDLYRMVNKNSTSPVKSNSIDDIVIRDGSYKQNQDTIKGINEVSFIVDIESLRQSYSVSYQWSSVGKDKSHLSEWGTAVKCTPKEQLKYGDFNCTDMFTELESKATDPIIKSLPYSSADFDVTLDPDEEKTLNATIRTTAADERFDSDLAVNKYKNDLKEWIISIGLKPEDYKIKYTIIKASLY